MTEREKLMELLAYWHLWSGIEEKVADYLLDNGVKIPVRCKDCKHEDDGVICPIYSWWMADKDSFFCAFGERRADNEL